MSAHRLDPVVFVDRLRPDSGPPALNGYAAAGGRRAGGTWGWDEAPARGCGLLTDLLTRAPESLNVWGRNPFA